MIVPFSVVQETGGHSGRVLVKVLKQDGKILAVLPSATRDIVSVMQGQEISSE